MKTIPLLIALLLCTIAVNAANDTISKTPAQSFCEDQGYSVQKTKCVFQDGRSCDLKDFVIGKCGQKYTTCAQKGFKVFSRLTTVNGVKQTAGVCVFLDKKECPLIEFVKGTCKYVPPPKTTTVNLGQGRDLAQYIAEKRQAIAQRPPCAKEGDVIMNYQNAPKCCPGLTLIRTAKADPKAKGLCTAKCGDFKCSDLESKLNCPRDCKK